LALMSREAQAGPVALSDCPARASPPAVESTAAFAPEPHSFPGPKHWREPQF